MLHRTWIPSLFVVFAFLQTASTAGAQQLKLIGTHGARVELAGHWKAGEIDKSMGGDQFLGRKAHVGCFLWIMEVDRVFLTQQTCSNELENFTNGALQTGDDGRTGALKVVDAEVGFHATQSLSMTMMGVKLHYSMHHVGYEDLGYLFMAWGQAKVKGKLDREILRMARSLRWPSESSKWARARKETTYATELRDGHALEVTVPGHYFKHGGAEEDVVMSLSANANDFSTYFLLNRSDSVNTAAREARDIIEGAGLGYTHVDTKPIQVLGKSGMLVTLKNPGNRVYAYAIPIQDDLYLDLRFEYPSADSGHDLLREIILKGTSLKTAEKVDAFPEPNPDVATAPRSSEEEGFFRKAKKLCILQNMPNRVERYQDQLLMASWSGVVSWKPGQKEPEVLYGSNIASPGAVSMRAGTLHFLGQNDQWQVLKNGSPVDRVETDGAYADLGSGNAAYLKPRKSLPPGLGMYEKVGPVELVIKNGSRRMVTTLDFKVRALYASTSGSKLLAVCDREARPNTHLVTLKVMPTSSGTAHEAGDWAGIRSVGMAPEGWLVSGQPHGDLDGVWLVSETGERERLVSSSRVTGIDLDPSDRFRFACYREGESGYLPGIELWEMDLQMAKRLGDLQPISAPRFDALVGQAFQESKAKHDDMKLWVTEAKVRKYADAIEAEIVAAGLVFPDSDRALDHMFNALGADASLGNGGRVGLALLLSRALLDHGATWVKPAKSKHLPLFDPLVGFEPMEHAIGVLPLQLINGYASSEDYTWDPIRTAVAQARGRAILISTQFETLAKELQKGQGESLQADGLSLTALQEEMEARGNTSYLRGKIYKRLGGLARWDDLVAIAEPFATVDKPDKEDLQAWLSARVQRGDTPIQLLRDVIANDPNDYGYYLLLGDSYANSTPSDAPRARACFEHVVRNSWGPYEELAGEKLKELGN
ncbi:MAG: hypothetical protein P1V35_01055 [Planctomycetota bacterium]|nr:hypothetical protein [Planctomycetota bacterium]